MLFGDRLRKLREGKGLSQAKLGKLIGVSDRVVGYYEANARFPKKPDTLQKISNVFNESLDDLLGIESTYVQNSIKQFSDIEGRQVKEILKDVQTTFASELLPDEEKNEFFRLITEMYFKAKKTTKKYRRIRA